MSVDGCFEFVFCLLREPRCYNPHRRAREKSSWNNSTSASTPLPGGKPLSIHWFPSVLLACPSPLWAVELLVHVCRGTFLAFCPALPYPWTICDLAHRGKGLVTWAWVSPSPPALLLSWGALKPYNCQRPWERTGIWMWMCCVSESHSP